MNFKFTRQELSLIEPAKKAVVSYDKKRHSKGGIDTLYSFVLSDSGNIYNGAYDKTNYLRN